MGICAETLEFACKEKVTELSNTIQGEMKAIVSGHTRTGMALGAIHIEPHGALGAFVGGTGGEGTLHLFFLDEGNGNKIIRPKRARSPINPNHAAMLRFRDGSFHTHASPYSGIHFVSEIAARHR